MNDDVNPTLSESNQSENTTDVSEIGPNEIKNSVEHLKSLSGQQLVSSQNVASQAYNEHFQPAAAELGKAAMTVSKSINMALSPVRTNGVRVAEKL